MGRTVTRWWLTDACGCAVGWACASRLEALLAAERATSADKDVRIDALEAKSFRCAMRHGLRAPSIATHMMTLGQDCHLYR